MQEEMKRMKVAMDREKERQREMVMMRRLSKKEAGTPKVRTRGGAKCDDDGNALLILYVMRNSMRSEVTYNAVKQQKKKFGEELTAKDDTAPAPAPTPAAPQPKPKSQAREPTPPGPVVFYETELKMPPKKPSVPRTSALPPKQKAAPKAKPPSPEKPPLKKPSLPKFRVKTPTAVVAVDQHLPSTAPARAPLPKSSPNPNPTPTPNPLNDPSVQRVKRDLLDQKYKLATKLKNVKAKEETLIKKENEIKKKEDRVQKLADNLRRQRTQLKKEKAKPSVKNLSLDDSQRLPPPNSYTTHHSISPKKNPSPMNVKNDHNVHPPTKKINKQQNAKLQKIMVTYDDVRGLAAKAGVPYEITKHIQEVSPSRNHHSVDEDEDEIDTKLEMNMYKNMFISDPSLSPPSPSKSEVSPKSNLSAYKTAPMAPLNHPLESNPFMSQQPKMPSPIPAPTSISSQVGLVNKNVDSAKMYDKWLNDYNSGFEEAMKRNGEKLREQSESHVGLEKLKAKRNRRNNRSSSAQDNKKNINQEYDESGSSRESRSTPEESQGRGGGGGGDRPIARPKEKPKEKPKSIPFVPASDSMALLVGSNSSRPVVKKTKKSSPIRKAPKKRATRSKKKTPANVLKPRQSSKSPVKAKTAKEKVEEVVPLLPRVPLPLQTESLRKLNQIIGRKRVKLIDLLPSAMGNNISLVKFSNDVEMLLQQNGFSKHLEGLVVAVETRCMNDMGGVDIRAVENEMRNPAAVLKSLMSTANAGDGQQILKKSVAKKVYKDFSFSFEQHGKENGVGGGDNQEGEDEHEEQRWWEELVREENRLNEENEAEGVKEKVGGGAKANPWLQSFDKRMSEALGRFERESEY
ncbi:hypothetical protein TL16_g07914 [Triparma laevis f. inornata]|uniref:Uncharacterized protein n=1 Tax=Triparma laevis f. inornata TaxID=1714386 RepID=A0A9W7AY76_9STRA|nr:hypothetical protein TL16_g07914 [Triparma laevis f. inornata]